MAQSVDLNYVLKLLRVSDPKSLTEKEQARTRKFLEIWPDMTTLLDRYRKNPNCSCRHDLLEEMAGNPRGVREFLSVALPEEEVTVDTNPPENMIRNLVGHFFDIEDTAEAYKKLMKDLHRRNSIYRGIHVRPLDEKMIRIYFY